MRPGKPLVYGEYKTIPFIGLPGNPVSAYVGFEVFLRPVLAKLTGIVKWQRPVKNAKLGIPIETDGRETFFRVVLQDSGGDIIASLVGHQGSGNLYSLVKANALIRIPAGITKLPEGHTVEAWPISQYI